VANTSPNHTTRKADRTPRSATPQQRLLTGRQAEAEYGPPYRSLYDLHIRGELPAVRLGRRLWFDRLDLEALFARSREVAAIA
jgi:hypothetical protein